MSLRPIFKFEKDQLTTMLNLECELMDGNKYLFKCLQCSFSKYSVREMMAWCEQSRLINENTCFEDLHFVNENKLLLAG
jgi:hypothetical protein